MDFRLSDETLEWKEYCRRFAREVIRPAAPMHDREESVPYEVMNEAYQWNLAGINWIMSLQNDPEGLKGVIYAEELHWGCAGIALAISASSLCAAGIAASGTPEQIGRWIPEVVGTKEQPKLGAYAVTEPQAGSDVKSLRTTAKRDGDDWILNGTKTFISNGGIADVTVVVATEIEAARLLVWRAAWMGRNGVPMTGGQGSMSKLKGGDVAMWATTTLMDLVGPEAQSIDCPLEKWFRDAKIYQIFEGTAQIQRLVIARMQAAEYAERLSFAQQVASTNGSVNGQVADAAAAAKQ